MFPLSTWVLLEICVTLCHDLALHCHPNLSVWLARHVRRPTIKAP
jgi:hypothetical protein